VVKSPEDEEGSLPRSPSETKASLRGLGSIVNGMTSHSNSDRSLLCYKIRHMMQPVGVACSCSPALHYHEEVRRMTGTERGKILRLKFMQTRSHRFRLPRKHHSSISDFEHAAFHSGRTSAFSSTSADQRVKGSTYLSVISGSRIPLQCALVLKSDKLTMGYYLHSKSPADVHPDYSAVSTSKPLTYACTDSPA
jgi:hypothetical protein